MIHLIFIFYLLALVAGTAALSQTFVIWQRYRKLVLRRYGFFQLALYLILLSFIARLYARIASISGICDRRISHVVSRFPDIGVDVLYFAADISEVKAAVGQRICLMGNLNPTELLLRGTPAQVVAEARRCMSIAADEDGGYLLAPSGALIPGTPAANIRAFAEAVST